MTKKIRILFLSSNPWTTSRILVDEEAREVFEKLQEGPDRDRFELHRHAAIRPMDLQRLLMMHQPHIVHFSGHGSLNQKIILGGTPGRGKQVDRDGLVQMFALYKNHVRLVVLNACFTLTQARSLSAVIDYSVGAGKGIGDKEGVAFAGAFYRALGFGKSVKTAFESAKAELALTRMPRARGLGLFVRNGVNQHDSFPQTSKRKVDACDAGSDVSDQFSTHSGDFAVAKGEGASPQQEKPERTGSGIPLFETSTTGAANLIYREQYQDCEHVQRLASSLQAVMDAPALSFMRLGNKLSHSAPASLREGNHAERANTNQVRSGRERRRSSCTRASVTLTIKVFKVALSDSRLSTSPTLQEKDRSARGRARSGNKGAGSGKRAESRGSD